MPGTSAVYSETRRLIEEIYETESDSYQVIEPITHHVQPKRKKSTKYRTIETHETDLIVERVVFKKNLTLGHAVGLIIGGVAGCGIFISPTGVTANVGSVGTSLIIWTLAGLFNLLLALCYAELGTALPVTGGDYIYMHTILGPLPAFLGLWVTSLLNGPCSVAVMAQTVGVYFYALFDLDCDVTIVIILLGVWVTVTSAMLNSLSVRWSARVISICSVAKMVPLALIIIIGIIRLSQGHTKSFAYAFDGSSVNPSALVAGFLPGFVAYVGWDAVNSMAGEMENPQRNLPLSVAISLSTVTALYVLTNMAYFTALTPQEFIQSDAVAMLFASKTMGSFDWIIPVFVVASAIGGCVGGFMSFPRYIFAGAKEGQLPSLFGLVSLNNFTPMPAIGLMCLVTTLILSIPGLDIQSLLGMTSVIAMIRIILTLFALLKVKWKAPEMHRAIKVPTVLVVMSVALLVAVVVMSVMVDPLLNGLSCAIFISGLPLFYLGEWLKKSRTTTRLDNNLTVFAQMLLTLVPGGPSGTT